jgi:hypothetical protein
MAQGIEPPQAPITQGFTGLGSRPALAGHLCRNPVIMTLENHQDTNENWQVEMPRKPPPAAKGRALAMLADAGQNGVTEAALLANGVTAKVLAELVRVGWATTSTHEVRAGAKTIEVKRVRITEAGTKALEG